MIWYRQKCLLIFVTGRLHVSLTSRLSIKSSHKKPVLKVGRRTKKFEKPCLRAKSLSSASIERMLIFIGVHQNIVVDRVAMPPQIYSIRGAGTALHDRSTAPLTL